MTDIDTAHLRALAESDYFSSDEVADTVLGMCDEIDRLRGDLGNLRTHGADLTRRLQAERGAAIARAEEAERRAKCLDARTDALRAIVSTADRMLGPDDGAHEFPEDVPPLVCIMDMAGESLAGREWCDCGYIEWPHMLRRCEMMKEEDDDLEDYDDDDA